MLWNMETLIFISEKQFIGLKALNFYNGQGSRKIASESSFKTELFTYSFTIACLEIHRQTRLVSWLLSRFLIADGDQWFCWRFTSFNWLRNYRKFASETSLHLNTLVRQPCNLCIERDDDDGIPSLRFYLPTN